MEALGSFEVGGSAGTHKSDKSRGERVSKLQQPAVFLCIICFLAGERTCHLSIVVGLDDRSHGNVHSRHAYEATDQDSQYGEGRLKPFARPRMQTLLVMIRVVQPEHPSNAVSLLYYQ